MAFFMGLILGGALGWFVGMKMTGTPKNLRDLTAQQLRELADSVEKRD